MIESRDYYIDLINSSKANKMTALYHYSGVGFKKARLNQGIYRKSDNKLVGVLQWGCSYQEKIKLDRYVKEPITKDEYLELNRFSMADSEGKNAESQGISLGIKWIKQNMPEIRLLVSYSGRKEGNYGYIYQATNWEYLGYFISDGFWLVDGEERHQTTLWNRYLNYGNQKLPFRKALCEMYHDVRQTWTKQFIYIQRLDKTLHCASPVLPYPKPSNEYPIMTKMEVYKRDDSYIENYKAPAREEVEYFYEKEKRLFTRQALIRQGKYKPIQHTYAIYSKTGELLGSAETIRALSQEYPDFTEVGIGSAIKTGKIYKYHYFKAYDDEAPAEEIVVPYLCELDGIKFAKQVELAHYLNVSRQAVSSAKQHNATMIMGKPIHWADDTEENNQ